MDAGNRSQCGLPDWHELSAAIRYVAGDRPGDHLITKWARALGHLHRTRYIDPGRTADVDHLRAELVTLINQWVTTHLAPATRAADVGPAADALAAAYIDAEVLLLAPNEVPQDDLHAAWSQVGYLATQWADLVAAVVDGQQCPPGRC
ncbi:hypothetical protein [Nocardia gamkensis]|uniref:DUF4254 domain-containing protein n=1 Tax=Nocardia gamkensis TaxID=352869 RepID=A0A7X6R497_9NOCA|nr:hypothetical protein [Nocardia gamkensis]NKY28178.1 DUF4254 domain-containing protein [Nocardia gamkensis]NQE70803.1 hypothetical protein [Nocardia gamkensis]